MTLAIGMAAPKALRPPHRTSPIFSGKADDHLGEVHIELPDEMHAAGQLTLPRLRTRARAPTRAPTLTKIEPEPKPLTRTRT